MGASQDQKPLRCRPLCACRGTVGLQRRDRGSRCHTSASAGASCAAGEGWRALVLPVLPHAAAACWPAILPPAGSSGPSSASLGCGCGTGACSSSAVDKCEGHESMHATGASVLSSPVGTRHSPCSTCPQVLMMQAMHVCAAQGCGAFMCKSRAVRTAPVLLLDSEAQLTLNLVGRQWRCCWAASLIHHCPARKSWQPSVPLQCPEAAAC